MHYISKISSEFVVFELHLFDEILQMLHLNVHENETNLTPENRKFTSFDFHIF